MVYTIWIMIGKWAACDTAALYILALVRWPHGQANRQVQQSLCMYVCMWYVMIRWLWEISQVTLKGKSEKWLDESKSDDCYFGSSVRYNDLFFGVNSLVGYICRIYGEIRNDLFIPLRGNVQNWHMKPNFMIYEKLAIDSGLTTRICIQASSNSKTYFTLWANNRNIICNIQWIYRGPSGELWCFRLEYCGKRAPLVPRNK